MKRGHEIAYAQFRLAHLSNKSAVPKKETQGSVDIDEFEKTIKIKTASVTWNLNSETGYLTRVQKKNREILTQTMSLNFWRPPTDNDTNDITGVKTWAVTGLKSVSSKVRGKKIFDGHVIFALDVFNAHGIKLFDAEVDYRFYFNDKVYINTSLRATNAINSVAKIGYQTSFFKGFDHVSWFGAGPHESYIDRSEATRIGVYAEKVDDLFEYYVKPQEYGNRTDIRWVHITDGKNILKFSALDSPMNFSARHYTDLDLQTSAHIHEMKKLDATIFNFDYKVRGVGTAACGPNLAEEYQVEVNRPLHFGFLMAVE